MSDWIPKNLKELSKLANELKAEKHSDIISFALVKKVFKDKTANELTKTIIWDMYWVREGVAYRINNGAVFDKKRQVYRKGVQRKGIPDIIGIINGRFIGIEVKIGADRQSADQKEIEKEIKEAGGVYFIAKSYDDYLNKINEI
tara:strand:- start:3727 stop:4158 length:432 start_codon:yes stop_codon:yes gene_type:complete